MYLIFKYIVLCIPFQSNIINHRCSPLFTVSTIICYIDIFIQYSAAYSSYTCSRRESYIWARSVKKVILNANTIFLPYLLSPNRDPCVKILSVRVHRWVWMLAYFTLISLLFLVILICIFNIFKYYFYTIIIIDSWG